MEIFSWGSAIKTLASANPMIWSNGWWRKIKERVMRSGRGTKQAAKILVSFIEENQNLFEGGGSKSRRRWSVELEGEDLRLNEFRSINNFLLATERISSWLSSIWTKILLERSNSNRHSWLLSVFYNRGAKGKVVMILEL